MKTLKDIENQIKTAKQTPCCNHADLIRDAAREEIKEIKKGKGLVFCPICAGSSKKTEGCPCSAATINFINKFFNLGGWEE